MSRIVPPPPVEPFLDDRGVMTMPWRRWFVDMSDRIGRAEHLTIRANDERVRFDLANKTFFLFGPDAVDGSYVPYPGATVSGSYVQAEAQATDDAVKALALRVEELTAALVSHGIVE